MRFKKADYTHLLKKEEVKKEKKKVRLGTARQSAKKILLSLFLLLLATLLSAAGYNSMFTKNRAAETFYNLLEGVALRVISPASCLKNDRDILRSIKENAVGEAVKTSLWIISPGINPESQKEHKYTLGSEPMYADYIIKKNMLNDADADSENTDIEESIQAVEETDAQAQETVPETTDSREAAGQNVSGLPAASGNVYSMEQLSDFNFLKDNFYFVHKSTTVTPEQLNAEELLSKDMSIVKDPSVPQILIYHTHASEAFADSVEGGEDMTIIGVGNYLTELLTNVYGYNVIHDTALFPYNEAYSEEGRHVSEILEQNPSIELVIDLHRDAAKETRLVTDINGRQTAKIMFFNGMCQTVDGPLEHTSNPYRESNLALSLQMKLLAEQYYPGFTRKNYLKAYMYNQNLRERSMLIEAGANTNTFEEVRNAMEPLAALLNEVLSGGKASH